MTQTDAADKKKKEQEKVVVPEPMQALPTEQSPEIDKLIAALIKVQAELLPVQRDSSNPFFDSKYAGLEAIWETCRPLLNKNGLAIIQTTDGGGSGDVLSLATTLAHSSGQWIRGHLAMRLKKSDPQGMGSAVTYARRYALAAIVGIAPEDDDGEKAQGRKPDQRKPQRGTKKDGPKCPDCKDGVLEKRKGKFGDFWGCTNYFKKGEGHCGYLQNDDPAEAPPPAQDDAPQEQAPESQFENPCPKCGNEEADPSGVCHNKGKRKLGVTPKCGECKKPFQPKQNLKTKHRFWGHGPDSACINTADMTEEEKQYFLPKGGKK